MENDNNFSDIPALDDVQGLENYLNNQALAAQGLPVQQQAQSQQQAQPTQQQAQPAAQPAANPAQPAQQQAQGLPQGQITREDLAKIMQKVDEINNRVAQNPVAGGQPQAQRQQQSFTYTDQERNFVINAMQRGYSLDQINQVIMQRRAQAGGYGFNQQNNALEQRMNNLEQYLRSQEYRQAEAAFIDKLTAFGSKFGLSENDLVTFGNAAAAKGINIAMPNIDLETAFRAIYPDQYAIRIQRMTPTNTSQIYGGTSIPESNRVAAAKAEDAYVDAFLKQAMPNQYGMLNKK